MWHLPNSAIFYHHWFNATVSRLFAGWCSPKLKYIFTHIAHGRFALCHPDYKFDISVAVWCTTWQGSLNLCNIDICTYTISCIYRPPSSSQAYYNKIIDMYERAHLDDIPIISMGDLNYDYKLDESLSNNPIHYIEMAYEMTQLILQPTRETSDTSTTLDIIFVSHPGLHTSSGVIQYNFSDHYLIYTEFAFIKD